jgi:hypothetical protein
MKRRLALLLCAGLLLVACPTTIGTKLQQGRAFDDMNERLFDLYHARIQASGSADLVLYEDVRGRLEALAEEARARAAGTRGVADQIGYYRIAAVAAWQAQSAGVIDIADDGLEVCEGNPRGWNAAPRDCGLIAVAGDLAAADDASQQVRALQHTFTGNVSNIPRSEEPKIIDLIVLLLTRHERLGRGLERIQASDAPEVFAARLARDRDTIACNADTTWALLSRVVDVDVARGKELKDRIEPLLPAAGCP